MKTFLQFISQKLLGGAPRFKGTPVVVDTHGSHAKDEVRSKKTAAPVNGAPLSQSTPSSASIKNRIDEAWTSKRAKKWKHFGQWEGCHDNHHLGKDHHEVECHLEKHYPMSNIGDHDSAIEMYTTTSRHVNRTLLKHYEAGYDDPPKINEHNIQNLDKAIGHHKLEHELHVYSGVGFHPGEKCQMCPKGTIHLPAYTSTSICKKTATTFSHAIEGTTDKYKHEPVNHVLHIHLKKGQRGLYVGKNSAYDQNEHEYILPRHTTLKVHPKPSVVPEGGHNGNDYKTYIWHAHVIPSELNEPAKKGKAKLKSPSGPAKKKTTEGVK